jgi:hypothetical protein
VVSDMDLLFEYELMCPETIIRVARISLFIRLIIKAPSVLINLVRDIGTLRVSWTTKVLEDLQWLCICPFFDKCREFSFQQWADFLSTNSKSARRELKKFSVLRIANIPKGSGISTVVASVAEHECEVCDCKFDTFQKLCLHRFKVHGFKNIWRLYVADHIHCPVCLKIFWNRERLLNHVRYRSKTCRFNLQIRGPVCTEEQAACIDESLRSQYVALHKAGKRRHDCCEPVMQLHGPVLPIMLPDSVKSSQHHALGCGHNYL